MCLHPDVIDALVVAGASAAMIAAACRAAWLVEKDEPESLSESGEAVSRVTTPKGRRDSVADPQVGLPASGHRTLVVGDTDGKEPSSDKQRATARARKQRWRAAQREAKAQMDMFAVTLVPGGTRGTIPRDRPKPQREVPRPLRETTSLRSVEEGGGGSARATPLVLISPEAFEIAAKMGEIVGIEPVETPPGWCGAAARVQTWLAHWSRETILAGVRAGMSGKRDGPPETPRYFEKPIARIHLQLNAPIPIVPEASYAQIRERQPAGGWQDSRDAFRAARAKLHERVVALSAGCG